MESLGPSSVLDTVLPDSPCYFRCFHMCFHVLIRDYYVNFICGKIDVLVSIVYIFPKAMELATSRAGI